MNKYNRNKQLKVAIIDYKLSNLFSVKHACDYVGLDAFITSDKNELSKADALILPGVGAFGDAMKNLRYLNLVDPIKEHINLFKPFMGVCLGLQLIFSESEEFGLHKGLDVIKGKVRRFPKVNDQNAIIKVPQIGWNKIYSSSKKGWEKSPLKQLKNNYPMYFVHSYYVEPDDKNVILSLTNYNGIEYCSSILYKNVFAVQFHPEKSAQKGLEIYKGWSDFYLMGKSS